MAFDYKKLDRVEKKVLNELLKEWGLTRKDREPVYGTFGYATRLFNERVYMLSEAIKKEMRKILKHG